MATGADISCRFYDHVKGLLLRHFHVYSKLKHVVFVHYPISYTPTAIVQNGDWFKVDLNQLTDVTNPIVELEKKVSTSMPTIYGTQYKDIKYLIFKRQSDDFYYIQKVLPSAKIYRKTLSFSNQPEVLDNPIVVLADSPDAIFDKSTGHLYFKSLSAMNSILKG